MQILKNAEDSEDASVDIFLELKEKLLKYNVDTFLPGFYRLSQNHCYKKLRKKGRLILNDVINDQEKVEFAIEADQVDRWIEKLPNALDELSEDQRWCIVLFYLHGKSYKEIEILKGYPFKKIKVPFSMVRKI